MHAADAANSRKPPMYALRSRRRPARSPRSSYFFLDLGHLDYQEQRGLQPARAAASLDPEVQMSRSVTVCVGAVDADEVAAAPAQQRAFDNEDEKRDTTEKVWTLVSSTATSTWLPRRTLVLFLYEPLA